MLKALNTRTLARALALVGAVAALLLLLLHAVPATIPAPAAAAAAAALPARLLPRRENLPSMPLPQHRLQRAAQHPSALPDLQLAQWDSLLANPAHSTVSVHVVSSNLQDFDIVYALVDTLRRYAAAAAAAAASTSAESDLTPLLTITIVDATSAPRPSRHPAPELTLFKQLVLAELAAVSDARVRISTTAVPTTAPDVLFLASCVDDTRALHDALSAVLDAGARVQCVMREPKIWHQAVVSQQDLEEQLPVPDLVALARRHVESGAWSFLATSRSGHEYINAFFPKVFSGRQVQSSVVLPRVERFAPERAAIAAADSALTEAAEATYTPRYVCVDRPGQGKLAVGCRWVAS
ncbi:uncharacterized protein V1518DRAFT_414177 [Limtongia smithiae]|uniref:uncharacterized protein n=1 Tax=Limtongia smithiae TaxID=1125753 RepID=UPI0034CDA514